MQACITFCLICLQHIICETSQQKKKKTITNRITKEIRKKVNVCVQNVRQNADQSGRATAP